MTSPNNLLIKKQKLKMSRKIRKWKAVLKISFLQMKILKMILNNLKFLNTPTSNADSSLKYTEFLPSVVRS
jgi:hypothetical protein